MCPLQLPLPGGGEGLQNESIFSAVHEILTLKTSAPLLGVNFLLIFWAVHDISRTFEVLTP